MPIRRESRYCWGGCRVGGPGPGVCVYLAYRFSSRCNLVGFAFPTSDLALLFECHLCIQIKRIVCAFIPLVVLLCANGCITDAVGIVAG